jgi:membrane protease YdiL (CAAX protease family)
MLKIRKGSLVAMIVMAALSLTNIFGLKIAGASVIVGVIFFFINKANEKRTFEGSGLEIKSIRADLKKKGIWFWILMPLIMDAVSITTSKLFLPEYIVHVLARTEIFVSFDKAIFMLFQLAFLALGEEIAWRAFFQNQLNKAIVIAPSLLISSALFALGHIAKGNIYIVAYDIFFVFINSLLYGIVFYRSNNAWISAISHFIANLFSVIVLVFI